MSKKSTFVFVAFMFLIISSIDSISSMLYMNWRRMRVFCKISGASSNSSRRVPLLLSSIGGEHALFVQAAVQVDFAVAGALEFFKDHFVHAAAGIDQRRGDDGERAAFFHLAGRAKEALGALQAALASTPPDSTLPEDGTTLL